MLGTAYYSLGRIAEAAQIYRSWLDDDPGNPIARHLLASCSGRDVPDRASDAYLEMQFDNTAQAFDSKMIGGLDYSIPEMTGRSLMELAIPAGATAPADLVVAPLIKGAGTAITAASTVEVKYRSWVFGDGQLFEDAWAAQAGSLAGLIDGWQEGLVGQTAGSRVMLVVPPAMAYPDGQPKSNPPLEAGQTLVYVIDILDVQG